MKVLILYSTNALHIGTVVDHLSALGRYSCHEMTYAPCTGEAPVSVDLSDFDAIVLHYSVRLPYPRALTWPWFQAIEAFSGPKLLFIQDEYERTNVVSERARDLGITTVFTCIPDEEASRRVYGDIRRTHVLTGYVPDHLVSSPFARPPASRWPVLGYRGRELGRWYGTLGREKYEIGARMLEECRARGVPCDISSTARSRIFGNDWYLFVGQCRAMLASESGASIFDWDGGVRKLCEADEITDDVLAALEARSPDVAQVSPKIFEMSALRTAMVLFEGRYSGIVEPNKHYIPLRKDFSNVDEVFARLEDAAELDAMTDRAYRDLVASGEYGYDTLGGLLDWALREVCAECGKTHNNYTHCGRVGS